MWKRQAKTADSKKKLWEKIGEAIKKIQENQWKILFLVIFLNKNGIVFCNKMILKTYKYEQ